MKKKNQSFFSSQILSKSPFPTKSVTLHPFRPMLLTPLLPGRETKLPRLVDSTSKLVHLNSTPSTSGTLETPLLVLASLLPWALLKFHRALVSFGMFRATTMFLLQLVPRSTLGSLQLDGCSATPPTAPTLLSNSPSCTSNALMLLAVLQLLQYTPSLTTSLTALLT